MASSLTLKKTMGLISGIVLILSSGATAEDSQSSLEIKGSSTIYPVCKAASAQYYTKTKKIILCEGGGSNIGLKFALSGGVGSMSRSLTPEETAKGVSGGIIGRDGLAFVVHKKNPLTELTVKQLRLIFEGQITNWSEIDKNYSGKINLLGPNSDHGTFDSFVSLLDLKKKVTTKTGETKEELKLSSSYKGFPSHNESIFRAESDENAIAVVPVGFLSSYDEKKSFKIHALKLDGIFPNSKTILDGSYPASRILQLVWSGEIKPETKQFLNYLNSDEGAKILEEQGFVPEKKAYKK
jgi:phosphate transport system substrate-binding protein